MGLAILASAAGLVAFFLVRDRAAGGSLYGVARQEPEHRLLIVGWDGATYRMVDPLIQQGRLPHLARLLRRGSSARLESTAVPISSAAWVAASTGRLPGETGVYGFFEPVTASYNVELISAASNRASPLWRILMRNGMRSVVFGVPVTYPPEPLDGVMVAGMLSPRDADYAWPKGLAEQLRARGFEPDLGKWREDAPLTQERVERHLGLKRELLLELMHNESWDLFFVVFKELDVLSHHAYDGRTDTLVATIYERLDQILGELLAAAGPDTNVLVVSDHGFHAYPLTFHPHSWLVQAGYSVRRPDFVEATLAPGPLAEGRAQEHRRMLDELDLKASRVLAGTCEGNYGGLRLNLAGREPAGVVAQADAEALLLELEARLRAERIPGSDKPLVTRIFRGEALYPGPERDEIPDLIFETDQEVAVYNAPGTRAQKPLPDHDRMGILVASGPSIAGIAERIDASIEDLAPTALHLLGLPVYAEMTGRARVELLEVAREVRSVQEASQPFHDVDPWRGRAGFSREEREELKRRLKQLGYVE